MTSRIHFGDLALCRIAASWGPDQREAFLFFWLGDVQANLMDIDVGVGEKPWRTIAVARHLGDRFVSSPGFDMAPQVRQLTEPGGDPTLDRGGAGCVGVKCRLPEVNPLSVTGLAGEGRSDSDDSVDTRLIVYFKDGSSDTGGGTSGDGVADMQFAGTVGAIDRIEFQERACNWIRFSGIHVRPAPTP